jgi:YfiH family protein
MLELTPHKGILLEDETFQIFFGNRHFSPTIEQSPSNNLCLLKQVHGRDCVEATNKSILTADAHWTKNPQLSLLIKTADCLPIMVTSSKEKWALAIHAGWRGVEQKIVSHALAPLLNKKDTSAKAYIGPHIQSQSFEVDIDVAKKILSAHALSFEKAEKIGHKKENKHYIDLAALVTKELTELGLHQENIWQSPVDTKTDTNFHSFRRGEKDVRNFNLVRFKP